MRVVNSFRLFLSRKNGLKVVIKGLKRESLYIQNYLKESYTSKNPPGSLKCAKMSV